MKKKLLSLWLLGVLLFGISSCSDDDGSIIIGPQPIEEEEILITDESGATLVNTKDIVLGESEDDVVFEMTSTLLTTSGRVTETTLNCCAMGATAFTTNPENGMMKVDSTRKATSVTLINRGTITVHTKGLVERYKDMIQTPEDKTRPYTYLRLLVMYAGEGSTVINEGTINVYFDHDPSITSTIYVMGMIAGEGSSIINNGEIHFYGTGSVATRLRGMATFGNKISAFNNGTMTAEVEICEDSRMITYTAVGNAANPVICALYDPLSGSREQMPSMVNRGTINVSVEGSDRTSPRTQGYGMYCDLMAASGSKLQVNIVNDGTINVSQSGPRRFFVAEAGFVAQPAAATAACDIKLGRWRTALRDFSQTRDLFLGRGVKMDFSGGELFLTRSECVGMGSEQQNGFIV